MESLSADERLLSTRDSCECHKGKGEGRTRSGRRVWAGEPDRWLRPFCAEEEEGQMTPRRLSEDEACGRWFSVAPLRERCKVGL